MARAAARAPRAARESAGQGASAAAPHTDDEDRALAAQWLDHFEGAGLDGVIAKPVATPISRENARC